MIGNWVLLKGSVRLDSMPVSETSSGWLHSTFLSMDYWLLEHHMSGRERKMSFIYIALRILYERGYMESSRCPSTYLCLFVWISHPNPTHGSCQTAPRRARLSLLPPSPLSMTKVPPPPIALQYWLT